MVEFFAKLDTLVLEVKGTHKLWALKSRLEIPLDHVKAVHADPNPAMGWFQGLKIAGTDLPNLFRAGMFLQDGNKVFWDVRHPEKTIVIEIEDEKFAKLIVEVEDPEAAIQEIQATLADHAAMKGQAVKELESYLQGVEENASEMKKRAEPMEETSEGSPS